MLQLILEQPLILGSILLSLLIFLAAIGMGVYQSNGAKRRRRQRAQERERARLEQEALEAQRLAEESKRETAAIADSDHKNEPPVSSESISEPEPEPDTEEEDLLSEDDEMLAEMFEEQIVIDPKYQALLDRLPAIEVDALQQLSREVEGQI